MLYHIGPRSFGNFTGQPETTHPAGQNRAFRRPGPGTARRSRTFCGGATWSVLMRLLFGAVIGCILTVGGAYLYDQHNMLMATRAPTAAQRSLVNWDVVGTKLQQLTERARSEWNR